MTAEELASADRAAALVGQVPRDRVLVDLENGEDVLASWDLFRAGAERASERFALLACRSLLAALLALYRSDNVTAPGAAELTERERRRGFVRTSRVRELLRFAYSPEYSRSLNEAPN